MSNLYQDAILDAKALRASAMANAKAALEEAFEPKIQEMISKHLAEEAEEMEEEIEEGYGMEEEGKMHDEKPMEETVDINEAELEEILNQLEEMSEPKEEALKEAEEEEEEEEEESEEEEEEEGEDAAEGEEEVTDETKVIDITLGDLKQVIQSLMPGQEMPGAEPEGPEAGAEMTAGGAPEEDEVSLEEILDELENEGLEKSQGGAGDVARVDTPGEQLEKEESLYEKKHKKAEKDEDEEKKELHEAKATIAALRRDLQEVNLLNAKYLYMNKLFKGQSLSESQKLKVINALDRATSVREVKNAYELMKESFETKKGQLKESIGFASKPAGVAPKANIVEAEQFVSRWQKLAGIKK